MNIIAGFDRPDHGNVLIDRKVRTGANRNGSHLPARLGLPLVDRAARIDVRSERGH